MPRSKRNKVVNLTKVEGNKKVQKEKLIGKVQKAVEKFRSCYLLNIGTTRAQVLHDLRNEWSDSKFFFGKNKVVQIALGKEPADEHSTNLHLLSQRLRGQCGLLFTNRSRDDVTKFFASFKTVDYARMGSTATRTITINQGPLSQFPHSVEAYLRQLGLPTKLVKSVVMLERDYTICREGDKLSSEQAKLLKAFEIQMAEISFAIDSVWVDGNFEILNPDAILDMDEGSDDEEDDEDDEDEDMGFNNNSNNNNNNNNKFTFVKE